MSDETLTVTVADAQAMESFGTRLARDCPAQALVFLQGELGAGKTTLVRGFLRGLGFTAAVKSPTYTLVEPYDLASRKVFHFDLYRIADIEELELIGIRDYLQTALVMVEWPERGRAMLPPPDVGVVITSSGRGRQVRLTAETALGYQWLSQVKAVPEL